MKIRFLGVGEAFDENYPTTSIAVESHGKVLLLDPGYGSPSAIFRHYPDAESIDYIYITHWHADHLFGLPALLTRWWEENRKKELVIISQKESAQFIKTMLEMAYPGVFWDYEGKYSDKIGSMEGSIEGGIKKPHFKISFLEDDKQVSVEPFALSFARTSHVRKNMAVLVKTPDDKTFGFSGDGDFTEETRKLFHGIDFLAHEAYLLDEKVLGHGCVRDTIANTESMHIKKLALVHINRTLRKNHFHKIQDLVNISKIETVVPEPGKMYEI